MHAANHSHVHKMYLHPAEDGDQTATSLVAWSARKLAAGAR